MTHSPHTQCHQIAQCAKLFSCALRCTAHSCVSGDMQAWWKQSGTHLPDEEPHPHCLCDAEQGAGWIAYTVLALLLCDSEKIDIFLETANYKNLSFENLNSTNY